VSWDLPPMKTWKEYWPKLWSGLKAKSENHGSLPIYETIGSVYYQSQFDWHWYVQVV